MQPKTSLCRQRIVLALILIFIVPITPFLVLNRAFWTAAAVFLQLIAIGWLTRVLLFLAGCWEVAIAGLHQWIVVTMAQLAGERGVGGFVTAVLFNATLAYICVASAWFVLHEERDERRQAAVERSKLVVVSDGFGQNAASRREPRVRFPEAISASRPTR